MSSRRRSIAANIARDIATPLTAEDGMPQEMHKITAGEVSAGYFTLSSTPQSARDIAITMYDGVRQANQACVGSTGATADFVVLNGNRVYFKNVSPASGLSEDIAVSDVLIIDYLA